MALTTPVHNNASLSRILKDVKEFALGTSFEPFTVDKHGGLIPRVKTCADKDGLQPHANAIRDAIIKDLATPFWRQVRR